MVAARPLGWSEPPPDYKDRSTLRFPTSTSSALLQPQGPTAVLLRRPEGVGAGTYGEERESRSETLTLTLTRDP